MTNEYVRQYDHKTGSNLSLSFFDEARRLLELECGKASLPTVQGLYLLYSYIGAKGTDRAGQVYRSSACEMLKRLQLERRFRLLDVRNPPDAQELRVISRAAWGLFCTERYGNSIAFINVLMLTAAQY